MQPLYWGHLRAGWADRMLQTDFLGPDAMPIRLKQTLFLLMYTLSYGIVSGYKATVGTPLNPVLKAMNAQMSSMRVSVEHGFGKTMSLWSFNGYKGGLKRGLSPVAGYFMVAVLLSNIHSCLYRNETCDRFYCDPPSLSTYLSLPARII